MGCLCSSVYGKYLLDVGVRHDLCTSGENAVHVNFTYYHMGALLRTLLMAVGGILQDKTDDVRAGIRSTALLFSGNTLPILGGFSASSLGLISYAGYMNGQGLPFYLGVGASAIQLARILRETDFDHRESCWNGFVGCGRVGVFISIGLTGDYLLAYGLSDDNVQGATNEQV